MPQRRRSHAAARQGHEVTSGQLVEFHQQVSDGLITRQSLQDFLISHGRPFGSYSRLSPGRRKERVAVWSGLLGSAEAAEGLMGFFEPFYALEEVTLGLAPADIDRRCRESLFWLPQGGVGALTLTLSQLVGENSVSADFSELMQSATRSQLHVFLANETGAITDDDTTSMELFMEKEVVGRFLDMMADECDRRDIFWSEAESNTTWQDAVSWHAKEELVWCLDAVYYHFKYGHTARARLYLPFLRLFLDGLWPFGLTSDNRLAVLCEHAV